MIHVSACPRFYNVRTRKYRPRGGRRKAGLVAFVTIIGIWKRLGALGRRFQERDAPAANSEIGGDRSVERKYCREKNFRAREFLARSTPIRCNDAKKEVKVKMIFGGSSFETPLKVHLEKTTH